MAAAGVDASNVAPGHVVLLPEDPDASARAPARAGVRRDRPQRGGRRHRHRRPGLAHRPDRPRGRASPASSRSTTTPGRPTPTATRWPSPRPRSPTSSPRVAELVTGKLGGRPVSVVRGSADRVLPAGDHGPGARALVRPRARGHVRARRTRGRGRCRRAVATPTASAARPAPRRCSRRWSRAASTGSVGAARSRVDAARTEAARPGRGRRAGPAGRPRPRLASAQRPTRRARRRRTTSRSHQALRRLRPHAEHPSRRRTSGQEERARQPSAAIAEQLRKEQQRKERRRSLLILGACVVVVSACWRRAGYPTPGPARGERGSGHARWPSSASTRVRGRAATPVEEGDATGSGTTSTRRHEDPLPRRAAGLRPALAATSCRARRSARFYTTEDRPEVERLVHSLEHGHTILWYDDTVKPGTKAYKDIQAIAEKFDARATTSWRPRGPRERRQVRSPSGKHVALTHWTGPENQKGVTQYCGAPSGAVVKKFMDDYPASNAPEPGAPDLRRTGQVRSVRSGRRFELRRRPPSRPAPGRTS